MTNVVVTSPQNMDLEHKLDDPHNSFWTFYRKPKKLQVDDIVWVVKNGHVVGGFYVRQIVFAKEPIRNAEGHNPGNCWRVWFDSQVDEDTCIEQGVLSQDTTEFLINVRGFQGFRYQWWP